MRAEILGDEQPGGLPQHSGGDEDGAGLGRALNARSDIGSLAEHFAVASTTTGPDSRPMRAMSCGALVPAFLALSSTSARWMASAARTARSASFSCACG